MRVVFTVLLTTTSCTRLPQSYGLQGKEATTMGTGDRFNAGALRHLLHEGTDEQIAAFLDSYAIGTMADKLIEMLSPNARHAFLLAMREKYPEWFGARQRDKPS